MGPLPVSGLLLLPAVVGATIRRCVAVHHCPYLSCLWSVTLSFLITQRLWLHCGSEPPGYTPDSPSPLLLLDPPPLYLSLSPCPSRSVAHRGPRAPSLNACSALLCTCDIGGARVCLCVVSRLRVCVRLYSRALANTQWAQLFGAMWGESVIWFRGKQSPAAVLQASGIALSPAKMSHNRDQK